MRVQRFHTSLGLFLMHRWQSLLGPGGRAVHLSSLTETGLLLVEAAVGSSGGPHAGEETTGVVRREDTEPGASGERNCVHEQEPEGDVCDSVVGAVAPGVDIRIAEPTGQLVVRSSCSRVRTTQAETHESLRRTRILFARVFKARTHCESAASKPSCKGRAVLEVLIWERLILVARELPSVPCRMVFRTVRKGRNVRSTQTHLGGRSDNMCRSVKGGVVGRA